MKAVVITGHGGNEVVEVRTCERPVRQPGEVLVRMAAATLNQVDLYMRNSGAGITHPLPQIMGLDGAGTVEEVDADERVLTVGQKVLIHPSVTCGRCEFCQRGDNVLCTQIQLLGEHRHGTFAEWVSVPARNVFAMPTGLSFVQAAALGVNHITAWRMLVTKAQIKPWETVLIFGIGGGVSLAAMQLAKAMGVRVIVTSRDDSKLERALALGADHTINSQTQDVAKAVMALTDGRGVDVVIENVGQAVWSAAMKSLVRGGRLVTCGATSGDQPPADLRRIFIRQLQILGSTHGNFAEFHDMLAFVSQHGIEPVIDHEYPMDQVHAALDRLASQQQFGKVGLDLQRMAER
ncbi:NADPH:quinone reductase [Limnohabitans sp. JirII-29]|uniref:zinc-binding dehydrogenase n=1 Tax=unclassified Limnohabitans TaxID=2626134 RepID=UPI000C1EA5C0|nr:MULTISPECIES: zinc-binding dehydrogenase [unclassified Limnohabitans]PIT72547.1 NADPH:quinone reductase [Limnohabitans sp. JirII-31]PUE29204.1 NADPH:quinone reductase [Limnohabitans sp. JirII-29]